MALHLERGIFSSFFGFGATPNFVLGLYVHTCPLHVLVFRIFSIQSEFKKREGGMECNH